MTIAINNTVADNTAALTGARYPFSTDLRESGVRPLEMPSLSRDCVAGAFSLLGNGTLSIDAVPGLVVSTRNGALAITREWDPIEYLVCGGKRFVSDRAEPIVIRPLSRTEVHLDWPVDEHPA
jgi:hypothetical protein